MSVRMIAVCLALLAGCAHTPRHAGEPRAAPQLSAAQLLELADALFERGDTQRAEQYYSAAMERGADHGKVLPRLLAAYVKDRQYRLAAQRAEDHLRRHPNDMSLRVLLAALCQAVADYSRAAAEYQAIVRDDASRAEAHFALATILAEHGHDRARADQHFRRYLALAPNGIYAERAQASLLREVTR